ncbi:MAG: DUF4412 domain-containing protein [Nitrospira sp. CR1.2]|nr:DUF4412 domain-containing protein [Nitrospira sp. CR1.2]
MMLRRSVLSSVLGSLLLAGVAAAGEFEGIIVLKETSGGETVQQQWWLKGHALRFEEVGPDVGKGAMIFDAKKQALYSLHHDEKIYLEISTATTSQPQPFDDIAITKTGQHEKVAGYLCEVYRMKDRSDGSTGEFCMAKGIGSAALFGMTSAQAGGASLWPGWMRDLFKDGGFPIKGVDRDGRGREEARWEAVKIESQPLADRLFVPPSDYQKQEMAVIKPE